MGIQFGGLDIFNHAIKICKEQEYLALEEKLHISYLELMAVESNCRRQKSSAIITSMQTVDRELKLLKFEYGRVKERFKIQRLLAIENYINEIEQFRKKLLFEKNALK
ncbi:MAG: hypothetical protein APF81_08185 [Desulfosporosinus sp. BRH_c37]|nr:MAG: hypothetical protein APF81_08185 [Desulfosporosinus sp. BRH_c37]